VRLQRRRFSCVDHNHAKKIQGAAVVGALQIKKKKAPLRTRFGALFRLGDFLN
jgi:hypothetical protein